MTAFILTQTPYAQALINQFGMNEAQEESYNLFVDKFFTLAVRKIFGDVPGLLLIEYFNKVHSDDLEGSYHNAKHGKQVFIRTLLLLSLKGLVIVKDGNLSISKLDVFIAKSELTKTRRDIKILLLAAMFHDANHTQGRFSDQVNISLAISKLPEMPIDFAVTDSDFTGINFTDIICQIASLIADTQFPYSKEPDNTYGHLLRLADRLTILQADWVEDIYVHLFNEILLPQHIKPEDFNNAYLTLCVNQFGFIVTALKDFLKFVDGNESVYITRIRDFPAALFFKEDGYYYQNLGLSIPRVAIERATDVIQFLTHLNLGNNEGVSFVNNESYPVSKQLYDIAKRNVAMLKDV